MRLVFVLVAALVLAAPAAAARHTTSSGLSAELPQGWAVVHEHQLALRGHGAFVLLREIVSYADVPRYPARPRRFTLRGPAEVQPCGPRARKGWRLTFRDGDRAFHAYVYLGARGTRAEALRVLDSLVVAARSS